MGALFGVENDYVLHSLFMVDLAVFSPEKCSHSQYVIIITKGHSMFSKSLINDGIRFRTYSKTNSNFTILSKICSTRICDFAYRLYCLLAYCLLILFSVIRSFMYSFILFLSFISSRVTVYTAA